MFITFFHEFSYFWRNSATIFPQDLHQKEGVVISVYLQFVHMYTELGCSPSDWTIPPRKEVKGEVWCSADTFLHSSRQKRPELIILYLKFTEEDIYVGFYKLYFLWFRPSFSLDAVGRHLRPFFSWSRRHQLLLFSVERNGVSRVLYQRARPRRLWADSAQRQGYSRHGDRHPSTRLVSSP